MSALTTIPAAQYLRMSTENQQYSLANQAAAISQYAEQNGLVSCPGDLVSLNPVLGMGIGPAERSS
jgi:hypothetical protein